MSPQIATKVVATNAASNTADLVIKTTAKYQEANEPPRQKPIIKLDPRQQQELMMAQHLKEANQLANTIRASIDSGRDNPFRPDGEIYKLTNPIVDYYKFGPNQSRSVTPSYAELDYFSSKNKRKRRAEAKKARGADDPSQRRSCWRRWFCCCYRSPRRHQDGGSPTVAQHEHRSNDDHQPCNGLSAPASASFSPANRFPRAAGPSPASPTLKQNGDTPVVRISLEANEQVATKGTDLKLTSSPSSLPASKLTMFKTKRSNEAKKAKKAQQQTTKKVVLDEESLQLSNGQPAAISANYLVRDHSRCGIGSPTSNTIHQQQQQQHQITTTTTTTTTTTADTEPKTTKVKTVKTSKCVIS